MVKSSRRQLKTKGQAKRREQRVLRLENGWRFAKMVGNGLENEKGLRMAKEWS